VHVTGFDGVALVVDDVERSLFWYGGVLGLAGERVLRHYPATVSG
jgi:catechol 2,3-dioxygenase-like lactoylglutathione lyase family enzyme